MASNTTVVNCPSCGAKNPSDSKRCASCGASTEELGPINDEVRNKERRYQQEGFNMTWAAVALAVQAVLTAAIIVALPRAVTALDFEGYYGMTLAIPVWFVGGALVGLISPGKTFIEPVIAALVVALPTIFYLYNGLFGALGSGQTVRTMPIFMYVIMAMIGVMFALIGSYCGERIQMGAPPPSET